MSIKEAETLTELTEAIKRKNLIVITNTKCQKKRAVKQIIKELVKVGKTVVTIDSNGEYVNFADEIGGDTVQVDDVMFDSFGNGYTNILMYDKTHTLSEQFEGFDRLFQSTLARVLTADVDYMIIFESPYLVERGEYVERFLKFVHYANSRGLHMILVSQNLLFELPKEQYSELMNRFQERIIFESKSIHQKVLGKYQHVEYGNIVWMNEKGESVPLKIPLEMD